jgi:predicted MPP superfamily phosphohydrolase
MHRLLLSASLLMPCLLLAQADIGRVLPPGHPLRVLAIGDYGSGSPHQLAVAQAIARRHRELPFDFGITMGDNFYRCGVHSVNDAKWKYRYENLYSPLGIKIYAALGNHDYGHPPVICPANFGSPDAEVAYTNHSATWTMPARYYTFDAGPARFFALDTEGWSKKQFEWLREALDRSQNEAGIRWRIVYGHHPAYTSGFHFNERRIGVLREQLIPLFEKYHVDLFVAGHDHDMEHLRKDGVNYLICGASGAELRQTRRTQLESLFHATTYGFLDLTIDQQGIIFRFYDTELHSMESPEPIIRK